MWGLNRSKLYVDQTAQARDQYVFTGVQRPANNAESAMRPSQCTDSWDRNKGQLIKLMQWSGYKITPVLLKETFLSVLQCLTGFYIRATSLFQTHCGSHRLPLGAITYRQTLCFTDLETGFTSLFFFLHFYLPWRCKMKCFCFSHHPSAHPRFQFDCTVIYFPQ